MKPYPGTTLNNHDIYTEFQSADTSVVLLSAFLVPGRAYNSPDFGFRFPSDVFALVGDAARVAPLSDIEQRTDGAI